MAEYDPKPVKRAQVADEAYWGYLRDNASTIIAEGRKGQYVGKVAAVARQHPDLFTSVETTLADGVATYLTTNRVAAREAAIVAVAQDMEQNGDVTTPNSTIVSQLSEEYAYFLNNPDQLAAFRTSSNTVSKS